MPPPPQPRILIADDEQIIADSLATILTRFGYTTLAVYSGEAALEVAEFFRPDIFISDVVMSGISGIQTAIRLCTRLPTCRVLLLSGQATTLNLLAEAETQGQRFELLAKPLHPADLLEMLRNSRPP